jgi:hypothetical protein
LKLTRYKVINKLGNDSYSTTVTNNKNAFILIFISILISILVTLTLLFGRSVLSTNSSMVSCSTGMIILSPSSISYKILILSLVLGFPIIFIIISNIKILFYVRILKDSYLSLIYLISFSDLIILKMKLLRKKFAHLHNVDKLAERINAELNHTIRLVVLIGIIFTCFDYN